MSPCPPPVGQHARWGGAGLSDRARSGRQDAERHNRGEERQALLANGRHRNSFAEMGADRLLGLGERRALRTPDGAPTEWTARWGQVEARPRRRKSVLTRKWHARFPEVSDLFATRASTLSWASQRQECRYATARVAARTDVAVDEGLRADMLASTTTWLAACSSPASLPTWPISNGDDTPTDRRAPLTEFGG